MPSFGSEVASFCFGANVFGASAFGAGVSWPFGVECFGSEGYLAFGTENFGSEPDLCLEPEVFGCEEDFSLCNEPKGLTGCFGAGPRGGASETSSRCRPWPGGRGGAEALCFLE